MKVEDRITKAKIQLQQKFPFWAYLSLFLKFKESKTLPDYAGMGVDEKGNLYYKKEFVMSLDDKELVGVLCFPKGTIIAGKEFKRIEEIQKGDLVMNRFGKLEKVKMKFKREIKENLIKITAQNLLSIEATKEHPFLIKEYHKKKSVNKENRSLKKQFENISPKWVNAKSIQKGDLIAIPKIKSCFNKKEISLNKFYPSKYGYQKYTHLLDKFLLNKETAWLLGLYVAEGSVLGGKTISYALNLRKEEKVTKKIERIVKKYLKIKKTKIYKDYEKNTIQIRFNSALLCRAFLEWCGKGAKNKQIPYFILYHKNKEILKSFLEGYALGDGYYYKKQSQLQLATISKKLALQLQLAYLSIGKLAHNYNYQRKGAYHILGNCVLSNLNIYQIVIKDERKQNYYLNDKKVIWLKVKKLEEKKFNGFVYNFETKSHTYIANNIIVHNCHEINHLVFLHLLRRNNRHPEIFNVACDICVNSLLTKNNFKLPKDCIIPDYNDEIEIFGKKIVKCNEKTAEQIYDELEKEAKKQQKANKKNGKGKGEDGEGFGELMKGRFDKHFEGKNLTPAEKKKLEDNWNGKVQEALTISRMKGNIPVGIERLIGKLSESKINWKTLLQRYITNQIPYNHSYNFPSKKSISTKVYMPHILKERISVVIAIDVSGSIGQKELTDFLSEIIGMARAFQDRIEMTLITHETDVNNVFVVRNGSIDEIKKLEIKGGGGTAHDKVFKHIQEKVRDCKCCVFLTDGYSDLDTISFDEYAFNKIFVISKGGSDSQLQKKNCHIINLED